MIQLEHKSFKQKVISAVVKKFNNILQQNYGKTEGKNRYQSICEHMFGNHKYCVAM